LRNEEVLHKDKKDRNVLHKTKKRKAKWIGHILSRSFLIIYVIEGRTRGTRSEEEYVSSYWMTLRKREDTVT
jgi:hypothetical protein